jgi:hypothetical protein
MVLVLVLVELFVVVVVTVVVAVVVAVVVVVVVVPLWPSPLADPFVCVRGFSEPVQRPRWPPPLSTAATALWETVIVTAGCFLDPVRWQTVTFRPVLVVVVVEPVVVAAVVAVVPVSALSSCAPLAMLAAAKPAAPRTTTASRAIGSLLFILGDAPSVVRSRAGTARLSVAD